MVEVDDNIPTAVLEERVLSAVLTDGMVHVILENEPESLFHNYTDLWEFIKEYYDENRAVPPIGLIQGDRRFFTFDLLDDVGATKHHVMQLKSRNFKDGLKVALKNAAKKMQEGHTSESADGLIAAVSQLKRASTEIRDIDASDIEDALDYYERLKALQDQGIYGIKIGIPGFDDFLPSGITPGMFGCILAYPQRGKSWLALYMAIQAWRQGKKPLFISLEMTEAEVRTRAYTIMADGRFSHRILSAGLVDLEEFKRWGDEYLAGKPSFQIISNDGGNAFTPATVRAKIDQYQPDIVFVDYLQLMKPTEKANTETERMKSLSTEVKNLCISSRTPIVAIASATASDTDDTTQPPMMEQVSWSRQIYYDCDWGLSLGRDPSDPVISAVYRKNRHGPLGEFYLNADFDLGRFTHKSL